ncbi:hypothetical protein OH687_27010 [Burkholderia anthina]|nr:hypothetical protein OH687_27010 [Burkholderia anthina]
MPGRAGNRYGRLGPDRTRRTATRTARHCRIGCSGSLLRLMV